MSDFRDEKWKMKNEGKSWVWGFHSDILTGYRNISAGGEGRGWRNGEINDEEFFKMGAGGWGIKDSGSQIRMNEYGGMKDKEGWKIRRDER